MSQPYPDPGGTFSTVLVWQTLMRMLRDQLNGVDVQAISNSDFNENDELIMSPPSVRVFFAGDRFVSMGDAQQLSYNSVGRYMVSCADSNLRSPEEQAIASAALAERAKAILAGARLVLADGQTSEPVTLVSTEPVDIPGLGTAYALGIEVPGIVQFKGFNAGGFAVPAGVAV